MSQWSICWRVMHLFRGDVSGIVKGGEEALAECRDVTSAATAIPLSDIRLFAPIPEPHENIVAVGRNYRHHVKKFSDSGFDASEKQSIPPHSVIFTRAATPVIGPGAPIQTANDPTASTDYEGEFGVVSRETRSVTAADAIDHVFGYTILNDVTARELQSRHVQWFVAKAMSRIGAGSCLDAGRKRRSALRF